jgi:pimeloyl-ACP methyl ester carboxylesterase
VTQLPDGPLVVRGSVEAVLRRHSRAHRVPHLTRGGTTAALRRCMTKHLAELLAASAAFLSACSSGDAVDGKSIVLVHGAWMGAWAWDDVKADLEARGATVTAVELPAHGADQTPLPSVTLRSYIDTVEVALDAARKPVMLVGHSMGGIVVTQAADERADQLDRLVYVTAFVPKDGDSLLSLSMQDPDSELGTALAVEMDRGLAAVAADRITDVFCADCDVAAAARLAANYRDEPLEPFVEPARLTAGGWNRVPKFYMYADDDHAISPLNQAQMTAGVDWRATSAIPTSHSPFLSVPATVADKLSEFAAR